MTRDSKRMKSIKEQVSSAKQKMFDAVQAFEMLKSLSKVKFTESVDISVNLGIDPKKTEQAVRGSTMLPKGTGKKVRVAVFAQNPQHVDAAKKAGADIIGFEDLAAEIKAGNFNFDILIATPDAMPLVGQLGPILGPRGLMPNPKVGTVTTDVATAIQNAKAGQVRYRIDKAGIIHCPIGTVQFSAEDLKANLEALITDLKKAKPSSSKGIYIKKITASTTMGPGLVIDQSSLNC